MSLRSNGVDRVRLLRKIPTWFHGTNSCIKCTNSVHFEPSFIRKQNGPKCTQGVRKAPKYEFSVQCGWSGAFIAKKLRRAFVERTFALIAPVGPILHRVLCCNQLVQNTSKLYETHHNIGLGYNGVDRVCSLWKILTRLRGTNYSINCTSSDRFEKSFVRQQNGPKCTQRVRNAPKNEFRVQWCGSGAFVAKNSNKTSFHELLN